MNIYQKLNKVKESISGFNKDKKSFGYEYVSGSQVLAKIKDKMIELDITLVPILDKSSITWQKHEYDTVKYDKETKSKIEKHVIEFIVDGGMTYKWINNENPEDYIEVPWYLLGQQDDISKAFGSGLTYSERYFLLKYFGLPTDSDDPDAKGSKPDYRPNTQPKLLTEAQINRMYAIASKANKTREQVNADIKKVFKKTVKELTKEEYDRVCNGYEKH